MEKERADRAERAQQTEYDKQSDFRREAGAVKKGGAASELSSILIGGRAALAGAGEPECIKIAQAVGNASFAALMRGGAPLSERSGFSALLKQPKAINHIKTRPPVMRCKVFSFEYEILQNDPGSLKKHMGDI